MPVSDQMFDVRFNADQLSVRRVLLQIRAAMERDGFDAALIGRVEVVMAELFNNIAEHAYRDVERGRVRCKIAIQNSSILAEVRDRGVPMPDCTLPDGTRPDVDVAVPDLPEGGFGWFLIRSQTDGLHYERRGAENCTSLRFEIEGGTGF